MKVENVNLRCFFSQKSAVVEVLGASEALCHIARCAQSGTRDWGICKTNLRVRGMSIAIGVPAT